MKKVVFDKVQTKKIIDYYLAPHSLNDATKFAGITKNAIIKKLLIDNNIPLHDKNTCLALQVAKLLKVDKSKNKAVLSELTSLPNIKDELINYYVVENKTIQDLEKIYSASSATIVRLLRYFEIKKPKSWQTAKIKKDSNGNYQVDRQKFQELYDNNTIEYIAELLKISPKLVETIAKNLQIDTKKHKETMESSISLEETYCYQELIKKYGKSDIIRQYKEKRYPFHCDFYIKSKDLFIECNYHWTHGKHPFDKNNSEDIKKLNAWQEKAKTSDYYKGAIEVWTIRDPLKLKYFKENNLNYQILY